MTNKNEFGLLTELELNDFEAVNQMKLPEDYRRFLFDSNGGKPSFKMNESLSTVVKYILGMHNGDFYASLYKHIDMFKQRIPLSSFPIATDEFGNLFLMSLHPEGYGHIYFWDHESEPKNQDGHFVDNCHFVAHSFSEFINNLK